MSKRYWKFVDKQNSSEDTERWNDPEHWTHYLTDEWICLLMFWEGLGVPMSETEIL